ncbi:hypothetical protein [Vibrio diazotrophicus]|uniref:hypothetical protein n=1 Tax=Vibrio diazotrophicus TaxID=685 RepID=UPI00142E3FB4|nr:hypothetical protein [Vibrio diazotrophicus]NIY94575.1 hypothetical protein [Vibrio diazotrophicus]
MKTVKSEFNNGVILTAQRLPQSRVNLEGFKLLKICLPALGSFTDAMSAEDSGRIYASMFSLLAHHSTAEHFESLQTTLFSTLLDDDLNLVVDADKHLDSLNINSLDVLFWLFKVQLLEPLMQSKVFEQVKPMLQQVADTFGFTSEAEGA